MKKIYLICLQVSAGMLLALSSKAILNYNMIVSNPGFTALGAGKTTIANFNWACGDQMVSSPINLGFTFVYDGTNYTQFEVNENGQVFLGAPGISCNSNCGVTCTYPNGIEPRNLSGGADRPAICPLWDDLGFNTGSAQVNFQMSGSAPNRIMTVEWLLMDWKYNNTNSPHGGISFQVKLYESPAGQIDFIYKQESQLLGTGTQSPSARIGLMGITSGDYYSTPVTGSVISKATEYNVTTKPATGIQFRWTQVSLPVELTYFGGKYDGNKVLLNWATATEKNNDYFLLERSANAYEFEIIARIKGRGNSENYQEYFYTDAPPPNSPPIVYYRLQQTDFDQRRNYSEIIQVSTPLPEQLPDIIFIQETAVLEINLHQKNFRQARLEIMDISGKIIFEKYLSTNDNSDILSLSLSETLPGIYFAKLSSEKCEALAKKHFIRN